MTKNKSRSGRSLRGLLPAILLLGTVSLFGCIDPPTTTECGGKMGLTCAEKEYCDYAAAAECGATDQLGSCEVMPDACTEQWEPVCGCDGKTYSNDCYAKSFGVSVAAVGECPPEPVVCGGWGGVTCATGEFCKREVEDQCGWGDATGICTVPPAACRRDLNPVCGCDDKTYSNECNAHAQSVSVQYVGDCTPPTPLPGTLDGFCGGIAGVQCDRGLMCDMSDSKMCIADDGGICSQDTRGDTCRAPFDPECGCDGKTYNNRCERQYNGVALDHRGFCMPPVRT